MTKLSCPDCGNKQQLIVLECEACGSITLRCSKCKHVFKAEEGKLVPITGHVSDT